MNIDFSRKGLGFFFGTVFRTPESFLRGQLRSDVYTSVGYSHFGWPLTRKAMTWTKLFSPGNLCLNHADHSNHLSVLTWCSVFRSLARSRPPAAAASPSSLKAACCRPFSWTSTAEPRARPKGIFLSILGCATSIQGFICCLLIRSRSNQNGIKGVGWVPYLWGKKYEIFKG